MSRIESESNGARIEGDRRTRVVVAGGAGYIGSILTRNLLEAGYAVRVLDRCFFGTEALAGCEMFGDRFELVNVDTRDVTPQHFVSAEMAVDLAGLSNDPSCALDEGLTRSINVDGGTAVLEAAQAAGVGRFVYQSSCSVYGSAGEEPLDETSVLSPVSEYSRSKVEMEERVLKAQGPDFEVVVTRPGTVFGLSPRMRFDLIVNTMALAAFQDKTIVVHGGGGQWRPLIHVSDVAEAIQTVFRAPADRVTGRIFNVGDDRHNYRVIEIARLVASLVEGTKLVTLPEATDPRNYRCLFGRIETELGFRASVEPSAGAIEIVQALTEGRVETGLRSKTVNYYRHLIDTTADMARASDRVI